ncbi:MAG: TetR/AcrR family transcriptional regulator [Brevundimonas sp.]
MSSENGNRPDTRQPTTRDALLAAAAKAFNEHGFSGTDTNRIAREAGFAPQTFYRHFTDKTDIFIRVYELWQEDERARIAAAMRCAGDAAAQLDAVARTLIAAHRNHAGFRRSLRLLSVEDPRVRAARAASRRAQLEMIRPLSATLDRSQSDRPSVHRAEMSVPGGVGCRIGQMHHRRGRPDPDEAVGARAVKGVTSERRT